MALSFGARIEQYDGHASDGDPTTGGPRRYSGNTPATVIDGGAYARSDNTNGSYGELQLLAAEAGAVSGANANELATAHSFNKVSTPMSRQTTLLQRVFELLGFRRPSLTVSLVMYPTSATGPGSVRHVVWLRSQSGIWLVQHQHYYEFSADSTNPGHVVVARDGQPWQVIASGGAVDEMFHYNGLRMPRGQYSYQSELNVTASADGQVVMAANVFAVIEE